MKTILQVEDDPNDVFLLQHAMRKAGVANPIQVVTDGQEAIDYLYGADKFADREKFPVVMPPYGMAMSDADVASVVNFLRRNFAAKASSVTTEQVAALRKQP